MDWDATEMEVSEAIAGLVRALQPEYVVETGTASAQTSVAVGKALRRNGHGRLVTLEIEEARIAHARQLCSGLPVEVRMQSSLEFEPEEPIDFAWFDSGPKIRHLEFCRYLPHMHSRTIVGFHDTAPQHVIGSFVRDLEDQGLLKTIDFPTPRGFTLGRVLCAVDG